MSFCIMLFSEYMPSSGISGSYGSFIYGFFKEHLFCSYWLHQFTFPPTVQEGFLFFLASDSYWETVV